MITMDDFFKPAPIPGLVDSEHVEPSPFLTEQLEEIQESIYTTKETLESLIDKADEILDSLNENETVSPTEVKIRNCKICSLPLESWQQPLDSQKIHKEGPCIQCIVCKGNVGNDRIDRCLKEEIPVSHSLCYDKKLQMDFEMRPVTITQGHLNMLNRKIQFAHDPNMLVSVEDNCRNAETSAKQFIVDMTMEEKFVHLKMMQTACATIAIALSNDKERIQLKLQKEDLERHIKIRDLQQVGTAEYQRGMMEQEKERKKKEKREREDPAIRQRNKTIRMMMSSMMIDEATAIAILDSRSVQKA